MIRKVLISGATGFLGSQITKNLFNQGFEIAAIKRSSSNLKRCTDIKNSIRWIDSEDIDTLNIKIKEFNPEVFVHTAWNGVSATERDNWQVQSTNIQFLISVLEILKDTNIKKIISLGSQAEYGRFEGAISESFPTNPISAYGAIKVSTQIILKTFAELNEIEWYWLRIFSVFGYGEDKTWLIPATINNLVNGKEMNLTPCEQKYDYMHTSDFAKGIELVITNDQNKSGIYNFSSNNSIKLKKILYYIENKLSPDEKLLKIGKLPYRENQVMHMEGNSDLFYLTFNFNKSKDFFSHLDDTIEQYLKNGNND